MSKYKEIKGFKVQTLASDTAASQASSGTWASGGALNTARTWLAGSGIQTAALAFGGEEPTEQSGKTESYNGSSSWTEVGDLNTARY